VVMTRRIRLTMGYDPEGLKSFPSHQELAPDALGNPPSSYVKYATWTLDPDIGRWDLLGPAPAGVDTLVSTRHGVMGVNVDWPTKLNNAGYLLPWSTLSPKLDTATHLLDAAAKHWRRLNEPGPSPQNLYEMTSLAYDSRRDRVILHGGGKQDELWAFDIPARRWRDLQPRVIAPPAGLPPVAGREAVYLSNEDGFLTFGPARENPTQAELWAYSAGDNVWRRGDLPPISEMEPRVVASQNRAMVYDPKRDLIFLVLGTGGDDGKAVVYVLRYRHSSARFVGSTHPGN